MKSLPKTGPGLFADIESTNRPGVTLWWLGHCGFAIKSFEMAFYIDLCLSTPEGQPRKISPPLDPTLITNADLLLCTHTGRLHMDPDTLSAVLRASPSARIVMPKSAAGFANSIGIPFDRMTTTDSDLRVEYFKRGLYGRVYSVPAAHPELDWTPLGGYPRLGYLMRFGDITIYHAGDCRIYEGIVDKLKPYRVTVALLPINGNGNFEIAQAAQLAEDIGARWLVPMHYGTFADQDADIGRFIDHMLGFRPSTGFKVFQPGERWTIPA